MASSCRLVHSARSGCLIAVREGETSHRNGNLRRSRNLNRSHQSRRIVDRKCLSRYSRPFSGRNRVSTPIAGAPISRRNRFVRDADASALCRRHECGKKADYLQHRTVRRWRYLSRIIVATRPYWSRPYRRNSISFVRIVGQTHRQWENMKATCHESAMHLSPTTTYPTPSANSFTSR